MLSKFLLLSIAAGTVYAQGGLTASCTSALASLATSPDASCLSPGALVPLVIGPSNSSVVGPIDNWINGICSTAPCSNETLATIVTNLSAGCATELNTFGLGPDNAPDLVSTVQAYYPTVRRVACLRNGDTNCVTETLRNVETYTGPLTITTITNLIGNPNASQIPPNITCTDCFKAAYNIVNQDHPSLLAGEQSGLQSQCGASFTDGNTPSGITENALSDNSDTQDDSGVWAGASHLSVLTLFISTLFPVISSF